MRRLLLALACAALTASAQGQPPSPTAQLADLLSFEAPNAMQPPEGWGGTPRTVFHDNEIAHGGKWSARIERPPSIDGQFSAFSKAVAIDFSGQRVQIRGWLRTEDITGWVGLWMREDGEAGPVEFNNMQARAIKGTTAWTEYTFVLPLNPAARTLVFGALASGTGKLWVDDLQLLVDGKPIWEAPKLERLLTAVDKDHEFDKGSGVAIQSLTPAQVENLVTLGKVWGFLKYHHPAVVSGQRHWDYDLFRVMPTVLAAPGRAEANAAILRWIDALGPVKPCDPCAHIDETGITLRPRLDWIKDESRLGADLSRALQSIYTNRPADGKQFYLTQAQYVKNPDFQHELGYASLKLPDAGFQLLAAYRFWNIIQYWSPYRDVLGENWDDVLAQHIPRVALATTASDYPRELMAFIARAHDTHANLWSSINVRPPVGQCQIPVRIRFVQNKPVIAGFASEAARTMGLQPGDIVDALDGAVVTKLIETWTPYYADSNEAARQRDLAQSMTRGACGPAAVRILRDGKPLDVTVTRVSPTEMTSVGTHDLPGDTFRRLSGDVAYLKLSSFKIADVSRYLDSAAGTKGMIVDIRNYPSEFAVFALGQSLVDKPTSFARFTVADLENPGAFHWGVTEKLQPQQPHYSGKIVILVDEVSQSQAEYTTMALRTAPGAKVVGSATAGADGNVSNFALPGGLRTMISGIGVFYPDGRPTQRIGILSDIEAKPTIEGIGAGRDEVLETAIRQILGSGATGEEIRKMAKQ
jgi:C-terminal processing protease CtpA/Prc